MGRGRKKTPDTEKYITGNPGKRPLDLDSPQPSRGSTAPPPYLNEDARKMWEVVAAELDSLGILTVVDFAVLEGYCQAYAKMVAAERVIAAEGLTFEGDKGQPRKRPEVSIANEASGLIRSLGSELGLSPAARAKVKGRVAEGKGTLREFLENK